MAPPKKAKDTSTGNASKDESVIALFVPLEYKLYKCKSQDDAQTQLDNLGDTEKLTAEVLVFKSNADFYQRQGLLTAERVEKLLQENQQLGSTVASI